jgi:hypothetical protein
MENNVNTRGELAAFDQMLRELIMDGFFPTIEESLKKVLEDKKKTILTAEEKEDIAAQLAGSLFESKVELGKFLYDTLVSPERPQEEDEVIKAFGDNVELIVNLMAAVIRFNLINDDNFENAYENLKNRFAKIEVNDNLMQAEVAISFLNLELEMNKAILGDNLIINYDRVYDFFDVIFQILFLHSLKSSMDKEEAAEQKGNQS